MHLHYPKILLYFLHIVLANIIGMIVQYIASISTLFRRKLAIFMFKSATSMDLQLRFGRKRFSLTGHLHVSLESGDTTKDHTMRLLMSGGDPSQQNNQTTTLMTHEETPPSQSGSDHWKTTFESPQDSPHKEDQTVGGPDLTQDFADQVLARLEEIRLRRLQRQEGQHTSTEPVRKQPQPPSEPCTPSPVDDNEHAIWLQTLDDLDRDSSYSDDSLPEGVRMHIRDDHSFGSR